MEVFTQRTFYTQKFVPTQAFTHTHTDAHACARVYTQKLLHTEVLAQRRLHTKELLQTEVFTKSREVLTQSGLCTQKLLLTNAVLHRSCLQLHFHSFYILLQSEAPMQQQLHS